jgi:DHA1 family bicyclomycin/chloramphenicol resistance-like MFS transporter
MNAYCVCGIVSAQKTISESHFMSTHQPSVLKTVLLLTPIVLMPAMSMDVYVPSVPRMMQLLHTSQANIQMTLSIFMFGMSLGQLVMGPMADRFGRKNVLQVSLLLYAVATLGCALSHHIEMLIVCRLLQAIAACGCIVCAWSSVRDVYSIEQSSSVYSYLNGAIGLAPILAPILGGYLLYWSDSWRSGFFFLSFWVLGCLAISIWGWRETLLKKDHLNIDSSVLSHYRKIICNEQFLRFTFGASMGMAALFLFFAISPILLIEHLGIAEHHFGYYFGSVACVFFFFNMLCPWVHRHLGNAKTLLLASFFFILGPILMMLWHQAWGLSPAGVVLPTLSLYIGVGLIFGPSTSGALAPFPDMAGTAAALFGVFQFGIPCFIGILVMLQPVTSMYSYAIPLLIMGIITFVWSTISVLQQK